MARPLDVVVWGATGFTGRLVCEHLARDYTKPTAPARPVRWALAGRNRAKLEALRDELAAGTGVASVKDTPIYVASLDDPSSLDAVLARTAVVLTTAGPYTHLGTPLLESALRSKTHYADLTAEVPWMRRMMAAHAAAATAAGVKIVHASGYDSQPTDLLAYLVTDEMRKRTGSPPDRVFTVAGNAKGGFSGGTVASLLAALYGGPGAEIKAAADPYSLCVGVTPPARPAAKERDPLLPAFNAVACTWTAPFIMAFINSRVARRSAALRPEFYGKAYGHTEVMAVPSRIGAAIVAAVSGLFGALLVLPPARALLKKLAPQGTGPPLDLCKSGFWEMRAVAVSRPDAANGVRRVVRARAGDPGRDPGYWGTARMQLELGLALALNGDDCERAGCLAGGFLTPATAGGPVLIERLRAAGITFEVEAEKKGDVVKGEF